VAGSSTVAGSALAAWLMITPALPSPQRVEGPGLRAAAAPPRESAERDSAAWERLARAIHDETNLVRGDPAGYAVHLEQMLPRFEGDLLERPGRPHLRTEEGAAAVREAITALRSRHPVGPLRWSKGLAAAAMDHVIDQGPIGGLEHHGTDGSDPARRAERRGRWLGGIAENMAFGENPARQVVIQLLVDDGVPDRGHRDNMLDPRWGVEGAACGPHRVYGQICVMNYAVGYVER
jgi:uncharacterized protein YkwD